MSFRGRMTSVGQWIRTRLTASDPSHPWWRWRVTRLGLPLLALSTVSLDGWLLSCGFTGCPTGAEIVAYAPSEGGKIVDRNGRLLGHLTLVKRVNVPLSRVPRHVRRAFVAVEDRRFVEHAGVDWRGFARALVRNVTALGIREGFSTITMQAARTGFLSERQALTRSVGRKLVELRIARLLEQHRTKDEILELYLNTIHLGNGTYGVEAASRDLFGKRASTLTVAEGAMLAAMAKAPSTYSPRRNVERALARRDLVLRLMRDQGLLTPAGFAAARDEELQVAAEDWRPPQPNESYALDAVRAAVDSALGEAATPLGDLVVYTTLDLVAQKAGERAVRAHAARIEDESRQWTWDERRDPLQGAMVAIDPRSGDVRALVGGRRYERGGFNRALHAHRQPGSAFKPFVYAAALAAGFTPASVVDDEPVAIELDDRVWTPANYGGEYRGPVTLRRALAQSANAATVRVSRSVGERRVIDAARRNGISSRLAAVPAIALGAVDVTPLELVTAYAPFSNGGFRVHPRLIRRIERASGGILWSSEVSRAAVMDGRDAFLMTSMLRSVVDEGTGRAARVSIAGPVAGKTGTTNGGTDVWFVGYTPTVVAGFWFGYDSPRPLGDAINGGRNVAPAWADFIRTGWTERSPADAWRAPPGLVGVDVDPETGLLASEWCPTVRREWFKVGSEPTTRCTAEYYDADPIGHIIAQFAEDRLRPLGRALRDLLER